MAAVETAIDGGSWRGTLSLAFAAMGDRTIVAERRHEGPFCIQRPFYPGDGVCHVYLLHPPGGLAGGDELVLDARVHSGAATLITTPAATKFYRSAGKPSRQQQSLHVASGSSLEWLPQDSILFGGSRVEIDTRIALEAGARFVGWEQTSCGRPWSGDHYAAGSLEQHTQIEVAGEPRLVETLRWRAGERILTADWGLAGFGVCGALYAFPADSQLLAHVREGLGAATPSIDALTEVTAPATTDLRCGATLLGDLLVVRCLARKPESLRNLLEALWSTLRSAVIGRTPCAPRIWRT